MNVAERVLYLLEKYNDDFITMEKQTDLEDYVTFNSQDAIWQLTPQSEGI